MPSTVRKPFQELFEGIGFSVSVLPFSRPIYGNIIGSFPHLLTFFDFCKQINGIVTITVKRPIVYFFHTFRNNHLFQCAISESLIADLSICVALSDFTNPYSRKISADKLQSFAMSVFHQCRISLLFPQKTPPSLRQTVGLDVAKSPYFSFGS